MHIVLDLRMVSRQLHGIARYALELSRRLPAKMPEGEFDLLVGPDFDPALLGPRCPNVRLVQAHSKFLSAAEQAELPALLNRLKPDLYHSPSFSVPVAYRGPLALTIHDANHLAFPEHYGRFHGLYYGNVVRPGALRARLVLTVSHFAQREIEDRLKLPPGRVRVVYNGVDSTFRPFSAEEQAALRNRLGLPERFVLYVGNAKPHKNVGLLVDSMRHLPRDLFVVLCVGGKSDELLARAGSSASRIRLLDGVADSDLPLLYASARAFAFPSLYEGFGLPPLEAMACGTPVVAAQTPALSEVLGDAALFVDPHDPQALAESLRRIDEDDALRSRLREAGHARASLYSWDRTADQVAAAYREAVEPFRVRTQRPAPKAPRRPLRVLFCVRPNIRTLGGGDVTQILRTKAGLEQMGVEVTLWSGPNPPSHGSYDLAHLFHLNRLDTFIQAQALVARDMPFVLSTIYWPMDEFGQRGYTGALKLLHKTLAGQAADIAKDGVRSLLAEGDWRWAMLPEFFRAPEPRMRYLVEHARCLLPNSLAEAKVLEGYGASRIRPIVNATDAPPPPRHPLGLQLPERYLLCAGRIEPRKNQLALVEALASYEVPLVVVGDPAPLHSDYYRRVRAAAGSRALVLPAFDREELFALYAGAEAHIAPAWYETPGLVSIEAAAAGTRVVTTDRGSTREYFGEDAFYLDPGDVGSMRRAVRAALETPKNPALQARVLRDYTWERAAQQTLEAYQAVLWGEFSTEERAVR